MERIVDLVVGSGPADERAATILRLGVLLTCIGYSSQLYRQKLEIDRASLLEWGASPWMGTALPVVGAVAVLGLGLVVWSRSSGSALWSIFSLIAGLTAIATLSFGPYFALTPPSRAGRYLLPIGLLLILHLRASTDSWWTAARIGDLLRLAIALTFFGHGTKALFHSQSFIDLLGKSQNRVLGRDLLGEDLTLAVLDVVGLADIAVAVLILVTRWRWVPLYLAAWTAMTASSRVLANGPAAWDDVVIRAGYYTIPLAVLCLWNVTQQDSGTSGRVAIPSPIPVGAGRGLRTTGQIQDR